MDTTEDEALVPMSDEDYEAYLVGLLREIAEEGPINASKAYLAVYKYNEAATLLDEATEAYKAAQSRFTAARNDLTLLFNPFIRTNS